MSSLTGRVITVALVASAVGASPAFADIGSLRTAGSMFSSAATVSADRACYAPGQPAVIAGSGYTPNGDVALGFNIRGAHGGTGSSVLLTTADAAGNIELEVATPRIPLLESPARVLLSATDQQQAAQGPPPLVTTQWQISVFNVAVFPWEIGRGDPAKRAQYLATGFTTSVGKPLYAHYVRAGRHLKTVAIGRLRGPCGDLVKRAPQFPFRPVPAGLYRIKLDATRRYPNNSPGYVYRRVRISPAKAMP